MHGCPAIFLLAHLEVSLAWATGELLQDVEEEVWSMGCTSVPKVATSVQTLLTVIPLRVGSPSVFTFQGDSFQVFAIHSWVTQLARGRGKFHPFKAQRKNLYWQGFLFGFN